MRMILLLFCLCLLEKKLSGQEQVQPATHETGQTKNQSEDEEHKKSDSSSHSNPNEPQEKNPSKPGQNKPGESEEKKEKQQSSHKFTGSIAFVSDYRSRGISQTFKSPSIQGEMKYTHISGFYLTSTGFNIDGTSHFINNTSLEWDFYLGFRHLLFHTQIEYNVGFLYYYYPNGRAQVPANTPYDTLEYYVAIEYKKLEIKLSLTLTDYFANNSSNPPMNWDKGRPVRPNGHSYGSAYLEMNYETPIYSKWKATFHIGYQNVTHYPQLNYLDWSTTLIREFEWFEVALSYVQTNAKRAFYNVPNHLFKPQRVYLGSAGILVGISRTF